MGVQPILCLPGYHINFETFLCNRCLPPSTSAGEVAACAQCEPGYFLKDTEKGGEKACAQCPEGATCEGGSANPRNLDGFWGDAKEDGKWLTQFCSCEALSGAACLDNMECMKGYSGRHCSIPDDEWFRLGSYHIRCLGNWQDGLNLFLAIWCLIFFILGIEALISLFGSLDLWVNSVQTIALIYSFGFAWPSKYNRGLQSTLSFLLFGFDFIYPSCAFDWLSWEYGALVQWTMPLVVSPLVMYVYYVYMVRTKVAFAKHKAIGLAGLFLDVSYVARYVVFNLLFSTCCFNLFFQPAVFNLLFSTCCFQPVV